MRWTTLIFLALPLTAASPAQFAEHTVGTGLRSGYQVVIADLNHDGKPDLIALAQGIPELVSPDHPRLAGGPLARVQRFGHQSPNPDGRLIVGDALPVLRSLDVAGQGGQRGPMESG